MEIEKGLTEWEKWRTGLIIALPIGLTFLFAIYLFLFLINKSAGVSPPFLRLFAYPFIIAFPFCLAIVISKRLLFSRHPLLRFAPFLIMPVISISPWLLLSLKAQDSSLLAFFRTPILMTFSLALSLAFLLLAFHNKSFNRTDLRSHLLTLMLLFLFNTAGILISNILYLVLKIVPSDYMPLFIASLSMPFSRREIIPLLIGAAIITFLQYMIVLSIVRKKLTKGKK